MPGNSEAEAARRRWASTAQEYLVALTERVSHLRKLFKTELETPLEADDAVASQVVSACDSLRGWLSSSHAPRGFAKAGAELGAVAGAYRNAAVAFRSLADVDGQQQRARSAACAKLLKQGDHHVEIFTGALAKKLSHGVS